MRYVFLDPMGLDSSLLALIMPASTGVTYQQQCGGTTCLQRSLEGYLVPVGANMNGERLSAVWHGRRGSCGFGDGLPPERQELLAERIERIGHYATGNAESNEFAQLALDRERSDELVEAWAPVITLDGPAILVWQNCD